MPDPAKEPTRDPRATRTALVLGAVVTVVMLVSSGARLGQHTDANHYALLAEAWLHGRLDLGGPPPAYTHNNDFAVLGEKFFVSFPPFPALLIAPFVWLSGGAEATRDGLFFALFTGIAPAFLYLALERLSETRGARTTPRENLGLAALFAFGTVYWFSAIQGTVWFAAHVVGCALAAIYLWASVGARRPFIAGLALGLAFATRPSIAFAFPFFVFEALDRRPSLRLPSGEALRRLGLFALPASVAFFAMLALNAASYGSPLEFGHRLLAVGWRARIDKWGLFSTHYLGRNLAVVLTELPFFRTKGAPFEINGHGLALWITSPFYAWAFWPRRADRLFCALALTAACVALPDLLYQNSGWLQFGYRFSNDFAPFLIALIAVGRRPLGDGFKALAAFAIMVNCFGALSFQRAGFERFYFIDGTQRILHQPD